MHGYKDYQRSVDGYRKKSVDSKPDEEYNGYGSVFGSRYGGYGGYGRLYGGYQGYGYQKRNSGGEVGYGSRLADIINGHVYGRYYL
jgi:hypothetical protein